MTEFSYVYCGISWNNSVNTPLGARIQAVSLLSIRNLTCFSGKPQTSSLEKCSRGIPKKAVECCWKVEQSENPHLVYCRLFLPKYSLTTLVFVVNRIIIISHPSAVSYPCLGDTLHQIRAVCLPKGRKIRVVQKEKLRSLYSVLGMQFSQVHHLCLNINYLVFDVWNGKNMISRMLVLPENPIALVMMQKPFQ